MMQRQFLLFQSHLDLAHHYWQRLLYNGGWAIDATLGNGKDTLKLAQLLAGKPGGIIGIDIQPQAVQRTLEHLQDHLSPEELGRIHLFCQSHETFPALAEQHLIQLIVYNLGYLPKGNKQVTTMATSTLESVNKGFNMIAPGGALCITCYPGHEEGSREEQELLHCLSCLDATSWNVCHHAFPNRTLSASVFLIQKRTIG
jgi:hypothetical protein